MLLAFHKPFGIITQFRSDGSRNGTLAEFNFPKGVYPLGRLDVDSEGLLLLSDEPHLNQKVLHPRQAHTREYWAQVERISSAEGLHQLERGAVLGGRTTLSCRACIVDRQPMLTAGRR